MQVSPVLIPDAGAGYDHGPFESPRTPAADLNRPQPLSRPDVRQTDPRCMDAQVVRNTDSRHSTPSCMDVALESVDVRHRAGRFLSGLGILIGVLVCGGCQGRDLVADNPVFSDLPPRRSLVNEATTNTTDGRNPEVDDTLLQVSISSGEPLAGNTVVAEINGRPLFVDDLVGSIRLTLEADRSVSDERRRQIILEQVKNRLDQRVDEEIVLHELESKVPEEQREALKQHLDSAFEQFVASRRAELAASGQLKPGDDFDSFLAQAGLSVALLRETFFRIQMVNGYVQSLTEQAQGSAPDRLALLDYYRKHIDQFTPEERLRWQEIRVSISRHGGRAQARQRMKEVIERLRSGQHEFGAVAREYSDALSAEENGNRRWLTRGALRDKKLEQALFALPSGGITSVMETDDFISIYRVARHEYAEPRPFSAVQAEIEGMIREEQVTAAREQVIKDLRAAATVRTIFDENPQL